MKLLARFLVAACCTSIVCCTGLLYAKSMTRAARSSTPFISPQSDAVFTSTREINSLALAPDGTLWAGTNGGVLKRELNGAWRKWTRGDGLPAHEVHRITTKGDIITAITPRGTAVWCDGKGHSRRWQMEDGPVASTKAPSGVASDTVTRAVLWRGQPVAAMPDGLHIGTGRRQRIVKLPPSAGSHASALLIHGGSLWVGLFGDGLWQYDGRKWRVLNVGLPRRAREITALCEDVKKGVLWVGTRRDGLWRGQWKTRKWMQHLQAGEPFNHNTQALCVFASELFVSTLEDGLAVKSAHGWRRVGPPVISSVAPRQMVEFGGEMYLRHGDGKVDLYDGTTWTRDVEAKLPRRKVSVLAADRNRLYLAQWGGWSEWDGTAWKHFFSLPELQGVPLMSLLPDGDTLWIGTQNRGLGEYSHRAGTLRWHDERQGLPDDWITCLAKIGDMLCAGTFVGGLAWSNGERWQVAAQLQGENITALEADGQGGVWIATRNGVWHKSANEAPRELPQALCDPEVQALHREPQGLWIGTRTGLFYQQRGAH
jgi:ligand-binding sensor domain-containing protein